MVEFTITKSVKQKMADTSGKWLSEDVKWLRCVGRGAGGRWLDRERVSRTGVARRATWDQGAHSGTRGGGACGDAPGSVGWLDRWV
jgi:hypothetical protein